MTDRTVSLLIVSYRSAELTRRAIDSARSSTAAELQVVVVDNSDEHNALVAGDVEVYSPGQNLGFAGGVNYGLRHCASGIVVVINPDVILHAGCIDELVDSIKGDVAISGPLLSWDDGGRWFLPPADQPTAWSKLYESLATRSHILHATRSRARVRRRLRFWSDTEPRRLRAISGAVMCLDKKALLAAGGFDERFQLYFEEVDLMRRLRKGGRTILYNPRASCRHIYNQSAGREPSSAGQYLASERAYHLKWYGGRFVHLIERLATQPPAPQFDQWPIERAIAIPDTPSDYVVEASPLPSFDVATGFFPDGASVSFPREIWESYRGSSLFLRVMHRRSLRVVANGRLDKTAKMANR